MLGLGVLAFVARLLPVVRGGGLHGVLAYDDGVYFGAAEAFVFGRLPYRDFLLLHPPGIVLLLSPFAGLARVIDDDSTGLAVARLAFMAVGALNAVLVYRVARARLGLVAGVAGGVFYAVWEPAVFAERTTLLEPWVSLGTLSSLLLLGEPRTASRRRLVLAGAALGLATAVKVWAVVPLVVLLCWVALRRGRAGWRYAAGAAGAASLVCLPFFVAAPVTMFRNVVLDQAGRTDYASTWQRRLDGVTAVKHLSRGAEQDLPHLGVLLFALLLVAAVVAAGRSPSARPWCALFVAQSAVVLSTPSYFPHYATYGAPALALVVGATAHLARDGLRRAAAGWTPVAVTAGVLVAVWLLATSSVLRTQGWSAPSAGARAALLSAGGCVAADAPGTLAAADLLGRDLRRGCRVLIDPTGLVYDQGRAVAHEGSTVRMRLGDVAWQRRMGRWFAASQAVILQHGNPAGLSEPTLRALARARTATSHQRYEVYVDRATKRTGRTR